MPHPPEPRPAALRDTSAPALRGVFGRNLRALSRGQSVSAICAAIGVNRTQFNRYLGGEAFPRPDVLARICRHFRTDARILLEPVDRLGPAAADGPGMAAILNRPAGSALPAAPLPTGFYRLTRRSLTWPDTTLTQLVHVTDHAGQRFMRSGEPRFLRRRRGHGLPPWRTTHRGIVLPVQRGGVALLFPPGGDICTILSLFALPNETATTRWTGTLSRSVMEAAMPQTLAPVVLDYLAPRAAAVLAAARRMGPLDPAALSPFVRRWFDRYPA